MSPELARILALPRSELPPLELLIALSRHCSVPGCTELLRPQQVALIRDVFELKGAVADMPVGSGKTLPTLLLPFLLNSQRPMLMLPAALREKTRRDFARYAGLGWKVRLPELVSYESLCRADKADKLTEAKPDLLMADECDPLHRDNAVARRVKRYVDAHRPIYVELSATYVTEEILDYAPATALVLREHAPVPRTPAEQERWAHALDNQISTIVRPVEPGLADIPGGFHEWYRNTRGVVCGRGVDCPASIRVSIFSPPLPPALFDLVRVVKASGLRPDGEQLSEWELPDVLCQIALGFYYVWHPMPPPWWLRPRRAWWSYVRAVKEERLPAFDTEKQIVLALDATNPITRPPGYHEARQLLAAWRDVHPKYTPINVPIWVDPTPVHQIANHVRPRPGTIVWCRHSTALEPAFESLGIPYYGGGRDPETAPPGQVIACSIAAHHKGKNLQHGWHRMLVTKPMKKQKAWEQTIGRIHRAEQKRSCIDVEILGTIDYHGEVLADVMSKAHKASKAKNVPHKLVLADWI